MWFGPRLRILREAKGLKQEELADMLELSRMTIIGYERNAKELEGLNKIIAMADILNTSIDYLAYRTDIREPYPAAEPIENIKILEENLSSLKPDQQKAIAEQINAFANKNQGGN